MRRVPVEQLRTGDRVGRDVFGSPDAPLLRAGTRISDSYRRALIRANIASVWIADGLSEGIEPLDVLTESTRRQATTAMQSAMRQASRWFARGSAPAAEVTRELIQVVELICGDVAANADAVLALNDLANADGYTMKHSISVTALGVSLGLRLMRRHGWRDEARRRRYDGIDARLVALGVGLLLHDIGKLAVPAEIVQKPGPLTDDEWDAMRAHPTLGANMLQRADGISPLSRAVVRSHHERWNGGGYPTATAAAEIHQFARIAAVADVFDALTSDRAYRRGLPPHEAYEFVSARRGRDFDPEVVDVFRASVAPYPPGTTVLLSDGSCAIVKEVRSGALTAPVVRVIADRTGAIGRPSEIDLSTVEELAIVSAALGPPVASGEAGRGAGKPGTEAPVSVRSGACSRACQSTPCSSRA